jgi:hypothetical protein
MVAVLSLGKMHPSSPEYIMLSTFSGKTLGCGIHMCPQRCHQLQDHSKMDCKTIVKSKCPQNHQISRNCHDKAAAATCPKCEAEAHRAEKKRQRDHKLDQDRQAKQKAYAARLAEVEDEIEHQKRLLTDQNDEQDRRNALSQKKLDLANLKDKASKFSKGLESLLNAIPLNNQTEHSKENLPSAQAPTTQTQTSRSTSKSADEIAQSLNTRVTSTNGKEESQDWDKGDSNKDWEWQKKNEGAENKALDSLMEMIGQSRVDDSYDSCLLPYRP